MHVPVYLTVLNPQKYCRDLNGPGQEKLKSSSNSDIFEQFIIFCFTVDIWFLSLSCGAEFHSYWALCTATLLSHRCFTHRKMMFLSLQVRPFCLGKVSLNWFYFNVQPKPGEYITHFSSNIVKIIQDMSGKNSFQDNFCKIIGHYINCIELRVQFGQLFICILD